MTDIDWDALYSEIADPASTSSGLMRYRCEFLMLVNTTTPGVHFHRLLYEEDRTDDINPMVDMVRIFDMDYGDAREYMISWMERNLLLRTKVQQHSIRDSSSTGGAIRQNVRELAVDKAQRFVLILETLRKILVQHGMLYVSGDYYVDIGHGSHAVHSGFSRVNDDPSSVVERVVKFDEFGNVSLIWNQKMYFSNDSDRIDGLTSASSSNNGNYQLLMDSTSEGDAFIHSDELSYHVYEISELDIPQRSPDPGQDHINIPMQLTHEALLLLCNELLMRRGVMNPFELMNIEGQDITGHPISLGAMFLLFKKYARLFGHHDHRSHSGVLPRSSGDEYVSMGAAVLALTLFYLEELRTYSNTSWTATDVLVDSYARWMGHLFCRSNADKPVYDTLCNQYLLKGQIMASMMHSDFLGEAGDMEYLFPARGQLMAAAVTLYLAESEDNPFEWALQLRLASMDVHKFMTMYGLLEMDNLDDRQVTREMLSLFLAVLRWHEPDFVVPEDIVNENEQWLFGRTLTPAEVNVLGSTTNDFSAAQYAELSFGQFRQIKNRSKNRQRRIVTQLLSARSGDEDGG